jgi:uncharacterized membrane protein
MPGSSRTALGTDENVAAALSYILGWISGVAVLLLEHENRFVRFHAMQSTIVFGVLSVAWFVCVAVIPILGWIISFIVIPPLSAVLWLVLMFKAYQGERYKVPVVGDIAEGRV